MDKGPEAFRTISEVAEDLNVPQHVLRFWETKFAQIKPLKRGGGRRFYRPEDVDLLRGIRHLLYGEGYTIKGVQRILKSEGVRFVAAVGRGEAKVEPSLTGEGAEAERGADTAEEVAFANRERETVLSDEAARTLRGALDELMECERLLAALREPG
ncbi:MerR family transcriptional regulator [Salinarimonas chemoclinalis]|uniref:MerR family transcriptional regulator n=1 Tax=Salinarimonas chemoclinalis TaxID=3241599 RepID=UPI00355736F0